MDPSRFDALVRLFVASTPRRTLLAYVLATITPASSGLAKNRKHKHKPKPKSRCSDRVFDACIKAPHATFAEGIVACQPGCDDPTSPECHACVDPLLVAAKEAVEACIVKACPRDLAPGDSQPYPMAANVAPRHLPVSGRHLEAEAAALGRCNEDELRECLEDVEDDYDDCLDGAYLTCLTVVGCIPALYICAKPYYRDTGKCHERKGCKRGHCTNNVCCAELFAQGCGDVCCDNAKCERCDNGQCVGCPSALVCKPSPNAQRLKTCQCPEEHQERCGETCCNLDRCEECRQGSCTPCKAPKICEDQKCRCPDGQYECGETCCPLDVPCEAGACRQTPDPDPDPDPDPQCPSAQRCGNACCDPDQHCCGDFCCYAGQTCCPGNEGGGAGSCCMSFARCCGDAKCVDRNAPCPP